MDALMPRAFARRVQTAARRAALAWRESRRLLERAGLNPVGELLRGHGEFVELDHYPPDDVHDERSGSQYYYHAHRGIEGEHGHLHLFVRTGHLARFAAWRPARACPGQPAGTEAIAHLVAVSMDAWGWPIGLFTTNRWVTDETWYEARQVSRLLVRFEIDHAYPSHPVNRALGALLALYRDEVADLLDQRDRIIDARARDRPDTDPLEDRTLDVLASVRIDPEARVARILDRSPAVGRDGPLLAR